jgi:hypothetical protein
MPCAQGDVGQRSNLLSPLQFQPRLPREDLE